MVDHYEGEDVIILLERDDGDALNITGQVTSISKSGGEENTEVKYAFGNKQILFGKPKEKMKVDFEVILKNNGTFDQMFLGGSTLQAGTILKSSTTQDNWRISIFFVPFDEQKGSGLNKYPPLTSKNAGFWQFCDVRTVSFEKSFSSDDMLVGPRSPEFSATDADGYANELYSYTNSTTSTLIQLTTTYAAEHRGQLTWTTTTWSQTDY
jgi:hypothetical protein